MFKFVISKSSKEDYQITYVTAACVMFVLLYFLMQYFIGTNSYYEDQLIKSKKIIEEKNKDIIQNLKKHGVHFELNEEEKKAGSEKLKGLNFVVSGAFSTPKRRKELEEMIAQRPYVKYHGNVDQQRLAIEFKEFSFITNSSLSCKMS